MTSLVEYHRLFRFGIRSLLIAMTIVAVALGAYVDRAQRQARASKEILKQRWGSVTYDFEYHRKIPDDAKSWVPAWILARTGPDLFHTVVVANIGEWAAAQPQDGPKAADVRRQLAALPRLRGLHLG